MGIITNVKVVQLALGLCLLALVESASSLCPHSHQYWHEEREKCVNCTACQVGEIVIRPCQFHRDAQCGPISELNIDWSFLPRREHMHKLDLELDKTTHHKHSPKHAETDKHQGKHHLHKHHHTNFHENHGRKTFEHESNKVNSKAHESHHAQHTTKPENLEMGSGFHPMYLDTPRESSMKVGRLPESSALRRVPSSSATKTSVGADTQPFSMFEMLVWDWQAVVLVLAVLACLLFFLVTGIYSIYHVRHWRRVKSSFETDAEEAYARRSLMVTAQAESHAVSPPLDSYAPQQSLCMDQLLVRKKQEDVGTAKGNFYIVRDKSRETQEDSY